VRHPLEAGDRVLFYTDGVTERSDVHDEMYELPRLIQTFERTAHLPPTEQVLAIVGDVDKFAGQREPEDDQTLLLMCF
jgi:sigma-B regulation protein RsbU (phosphoserine phosphatase)